MTHLRRTWNEHANHINRWVLKCCSVGEAHLDQTWDSTRYCHIGELSRKFLCIPWFFQIKQSYFNIIPSYFKSYDNISCKTTFLAFNIMISVIHIIIYHYLLSIIFIYYYLFVIRITYHTRNTNISMINEAKEMIYGWI